MAHKRYMIRPVPGVVPVRFCLWLSENWSVFVPAGVFYTEQEARDTATARDWQEADDKPARDALARAQAALDTLIAHPGLDRVVGDEDLASLAEVVGRLEALVDALNESHL